MNLIILLLVQLLIAQIHPLPKVCLAGLKGQTQVYVCTTGGTLASSAGSYAEEIPVSTEWFVTHCKQKSAKQIPYGTVAVCDAYAQRTEP